MKKYGLLIGLLILLIVVATGFYFAGAYFKPTQQVSTIGITPTPKATTSAETSVSPSPSISSEPTLTETPTPTLTPTPTSGGTFKFPGIYRTFVTVTPTPTPLILQRKTIEFQQ